MSKSTAWNESIHKSNAPEKPATSPTGLRSEAEVQDALAAQDDERQSHLRQGILISAPDFALLKCDRSYAFRLTDKGSKILQGVVVGAVDGSKRDDQVASFETLHTPRA